MKTTKKWGKVLLAGMSVMVLAFGVFFIGCDTPTGNNNTDDNTTATPQTFEFEGVDAYQNAVKATFTGNTTGDIRGGTNYNYTVTVGTTEVSSGTAVIASNMLIFTSSESHIFTAIISTTSTAITFTNKIPGLSSSAVTSLLVSGKHLSIPAQPQSLNGTATINGTPIKGKTLTALTEKIVPASGTLSYKWIRSDGVTASTVGSTYTLSSSDVGKAIEVEVSCAGISGTRVSNSIGPITAENAPPPPGSPTITVSPAACEVESESDEFRMGEPVVRGDENPESMYVYLVDNADETHGGYRFPEYYDAYYYYTDENFEGFHEVFGDDAPSAVPLIITVPKSHGVLVGLQLWDNLSGRWIYWSNSRNVLDSSLTAPEGDIDQNFNIASSEDGTYWILTARLGVRPFAGYNTSNGPETAYYVSSHLRLVFTK